MNLLVTLLCAGTSRVPCRVPATVRLLLDFLVRIIGRPGRGFCALEKALNRGGYTAEGTFQDFQVRRDEWGGLKEQRDCS